jgi:Adaptive response protein AidB N-terminal domain
MPSDCPPSSAYAGFFQPSPQTPNPLTSDPLLRRILRRHLPAPVLAAATPSFQTLAAQSVSPRIREYTRDTNLNLPTVIHWDGWGKRKDELRTCEGWKRLKGFWAESGMMRDFYDRPYGEYSRLVGFTKYPLTRSFGLAL